MSVVVCGNVLRPLKAASVVDAREACRLLAVSSMLYDARLRALVVQHFPGIGWSRSAGEIHRNEGCCLFGIQRHNGDDVVKLALPFQIIPGTGAKTYIYR